MVSTDSARNIVGIVGNVISIFLFLSPLPTIVSVCKNRSVQKFSSTPYLATCCNCVIWVLYGLPWVKPDSLLVITVNGIGTVIELIYIIIFLVFADEKKQRIRILLVVAIDIIFMVILSACTFTVLHTTAKRTEVVGIICIIFNISMYASPLSVLVGSCLYTRYHHQFLKIVIQKKSVEYMPFPISLASLLNSAIWTTYALLRFDAFILIPNGIGVIFSLLQLLLYAIYFKSTQSQLASRKEQEAKGGEIGLSEIVIRNDDDQAKTVPT